MNELLGESSQSFHDSNLSFDPSYAAAVAYNGPFYESESSLTSTHSDSHFSGSEGNYGMYEQYVYDE